MRDSFEKLRWWSLLKLFKEENETLFLKIWSSLKSKLGKSCIELWPTVIVTKKYIFHIYNFFPEEMNVFLFKYVINKSWNSLKLVIN